MIVAYFGERVDTLNCNQSCDFCQNPNRVKDLIRRFVVNGSSFSRSTSFDQSGPGELKSVLSFFVSSFTD